MKIGFILKDTSLGGGERILHMLMRSFSREGHTIIIFSWNEEWNNMVLDFPASINILNCSPKKFKKLKAINEFNNVLKNTRPHCLITFDKSIAETALLPAKIRHIPFFISERVDPIFSPVSKIHRFLTRMIYRYSDGVVFQTKKVQDYFRKYLKNNSIVIPNALIDDTLPIANIDNPKKEIIGIGRLSSQKNFELLIDVFHEINLPDYVLKIYGDGPLRKSLEDKVEKYGLKDRAFLMGKVDKVVDCIVESDIFVLSSVWEGMPNVLLESMAMGLACVSFDVPSGGAASLIKNGINGILVPNNDKEKLKESIQLIANNPQLKQAIKVEALKVRTDYSRDVIIPQWISFIENTIKKYSL